MAYIKDLDFCDYFENSHRLKYGYKNLIAIGWLDTPAEVPTGKAPAGFVDKLKHLFDTRHEFLMYCGHHDCAYCDQWENQGQAFIPAKKVVYAAPLGILHYIEAHGYCPPQEFIDAVMAYQGELSGDEYARRVKDIDERLYWMLHRHDHNAYNNGEDRASREYPWTKEWNKIEAQEERRRIAQMTEKERQYEERSKIRLPHNDLVDALKKEFSKNFFR